MFYYGTDNTSCFYNNNSFFVLNSIVSDSGTSYNIVYITILFRVLLIVIKEWVGFLGFDIIQYIEIYSQISDIQKCTKKYV